jgi:broad specificity phosphatase PhoE
MRLFVFARHAESAANAAHVLSSDPFRPSALTSRGRAQARRLGSQIDNLDIDFAVCTRFPRTRQTLDLALRGRDIPVIIEPDLDEVRAGVFDGAPIEAYWAWKERHPRSERFPGGESLDEAVRRYADALTRLLARKEAVTLIVAHELALRYMLEAAAGVGEANRSKPRAENAVPYFFDERAVRRTAECLDALAPAAPAETRRAEAA